MSPSAAVWRIDALLIVCEQQWSSTAQRKKMDHACSSDHLIVGLSLSMGFVDNKEVQMIRKCTVHHVIAWAWYWLELHDMIHLNQQ